MTRDEFACLLENIQTLEMEVREAGQKEYAHDENDAFANFKRTAEYLDLDPKKVLMVFALKHLDGIASHIKGHTSQREDVTGRIKDLRMYLALLWGMISEERNHKKIHQKRFTTLGGEEFVIDTLRPPTTIVEE